MNPNKWPYGDPQDFRERFMYDRDIYKDYPQDKDMPQSSPNTDFTDPKVDLHKEMVPAIWNK